MIFACDVSLASFKIKLYVTCAVTPPYLPIPQWPLPCFPAFPFRTSIRSCCRRAMSDVHANPFVCARAAHVGAARAWHIPGRADHQRQSAASPYRMTSPCHVCCISWSHLMAASQPHPNVGMQTNLTALQVLPSASNVTSSIGDFGDFAHSPVSASRVFI